MIDLDIFSQGAIAALFQVIMIDLVLAGDNAVVIGLAAAGLPPERRSRAILAGIIVATVLRTRVRRNCGRTAGDRGLTSCRRHSAALGVLEDVA